MEMNRTAKYIVCGKFRLTGNAKLLYCYLTDSVNSRQQLTMSSRKIAAVIGVSRSAVSRNMHLLERSGLIDISPQFTIDGGRTANKYILK
jgi:DNA-binding transcriptional MocR family regulator